MSDNGKPISKGRRKRLRERIAEHPDKYGFQRDTPARTVVELLDLIDSQCGELQDLRRQVKKLSRERDPLYMRLPD